MNANVPPETGAAVVHNDYKYDNVMLDPRDLTRIVAVLDWEMATVGDPLLDLGTLLGYWSDPDDPPDMRARPYGPTFLPGSLSRAQLVERYARRSGRDPSSILFYYVLALFKIAVILQQIYKRFVEGKGWNIKGTYLDDGWSGAVLARPNLDRLRDDSACGMFDAVIVNDVDRLARDVSHLGIVKRDLEKKNVQYQEIDVSWDDEARIKLTQTTGLRTVPQIFIGERHVGGSDELHALEARGELDPLLQ